MYKTAVDFNKEQEEKKAAKELAEGVKEKKVVMTRDGKRFICANPGCVDKSFLMEENKDDACRHHTGEAVFHDQ